MATVEAWRDEARRWFERLRDDLCAAFERLEDDLPADAPHAECAAERFLATPWTRAGGGGGLMSVLRGRVFEKAGIHTSCVTGEFTPEFRSQIPGAAEDAHFWAAGVSLIAHPRNPHVPTAHLNTRLVMTRMWWFGGGGDLTPMLARRRAESDPDTVAFHAAMQAACARHAIADYARYKRWCDEYFYLPHRRETRGVGGIFYDYLTPSDAEGGFAAAFALTQDVGRAFLAAYPGIVRRNFAVPYGAAEREEQLVRRGRYVEFNLLYDRGTMFGLKTGGHVEAILSSMPPLVKWP
jgi:coproporphyrinogen III oxidase